MIANKGQLRRNRGDELVNQASCLNLVTNAVIVWNTVYMAEAVAQLKREGYPVNESDLAHIWPTRYAHINVYGRYHFNIEEARGRRAYDHCGSRDAGLAYKISPILRGSQYARGGDSGSPRDVQGAAAPPTAPRADAGGMSARRADPVRGAGGSHPARRRTGRAAHAGPTTPGRSPRKTREATGAAADADAGRALSANGAGFFLPPSICTACRAPQFDPPAENTITYAEDPVTRFIVKEVAKLWGDGRSECV